MPAESLIIQRSAGKKLLKIPLHSHKKVVSALDNIKKNPISGIRLGGELGGYYKFRVGDYRIVYSFDKKKSIVNVVKIEHRQGVYK